MEFSLLAWLRFLWKRSRLRRAQNRLAHIYDKELEKALKARKNRLELDSLHADRSFEMEFVYDELADFETKYWLRKAHYLKVAVPSHDEGDCWDKSSQTGMWSLSPKGMTRVRSAIRAEQKEASESLRTWLPTAIAAFAAIGAWIAALRH